MIRMMIAIVLILYLAGCGDSGSSPTLAETANGTVMTSTNNGGTWSNPVPVVANKELNGIAYGNNTFVAVGQDGTILTSADGTTWAIQTSGTMNSLYGITFANVNGGLFVAVGDAGTILTSTDNGKTWNGQNSGAPAQLTGVTYGNGTYVAVGASAILTSLDGTTWSTQLYGPTRYFYSVTYGNNEFVIASDSGGILTSSNGTVWVARNSGTANNLYGITYGVDTFVAVGVNTILTSPDGVVWTPRPSGTTGNLVGVTYANNQYIVVGNTMGINSTGFILTSSDDGVTWTSHATTSNLYGGVFGSGTFILVG